MLVALTVTRDMDGWTLRSSRTRLGNPLADGNTVTISKSLKVKGKGNPSDISVDGFGSMVLTSRVLKKV